MGWEVRTAVPSQRDWAGLCHCDDAGAQWGQTLFPSTPTKTVQPGINNLREAFSRETSFRGTHSESSAKTERSNRIPPSGPRPWKPATPAGAGGESPYEARLTRRDENGWEVRTAVPSLREWAGLCHCDDAGGQWGQTSLPGTPTRTVQRGMNNLRRHFRESPLDEARLTRRDENGWEVWTAVPWVRDWAGLVPWRRRSARNGDRLRFGALPPEPFNEESTTYGGIFERVPL